ncbi:MAG: hypothetical protein VR64_06670 [Desulfatitalea sp. BRH_c12]|nr:MAG: hypothetical protein VR64_06670 [Desulfatitalea sp. BRH_c12]
MEKTKISQLIDAGILIEKTKTGFTVRELMSALHWREDQTQYARNVMVALTNKGQAIKLNNSRPVVYSFKKKGTAPAKGTAKAAKGQTRPHAEQPTRAASAPQASEEHAPRPVNASAKAVASHEGLAQRDIPLEPQSGGEIQHIRKLERRITELEAELVDIKRKLGEAQTRIGEQDRMIARQDRIILGQKKDRKSPITIWKRRS